MNRTAQPDAGTPVTIEEIVEAVEGVITPTTEISIYEKIILGIRYHSILLHSLHNLP